MSDAITMPATAGRRLKEQVMYEKSVERLQALSFLGLISNGEQTLDQRHPFFVFGGRFQASRPKESGNG